MKKNLLSIALLCLTSGFAEAKIIQVPDEQLTISDGINAAADGDTVMVADGVYNGPQNSGLSFNGRAITVTSENGPDSCIINCGYHNSGFYFTSGETSASVLRGFTITAGVNTYGGGLQITNSSPTIENCIIRNNISTYGGGVFIADGNPSIVRCTIFQNTSKSGGSIFLTHASPLITSCIITDNEATG